MAACPVQAAGIGFVYGAVSSSLIFSWMFAVAGFDVRHLLIGATYFGLYPATWAFCVRALKPTSFSLPPLAASLWVLMEFARNHAGFLALPWATLAHSQTYDLPLLQVAACLGEHGISFVVVLVGACGWLAWSRRTWRPLAPALLVLGLVHAWGVFELARSTPAGALRVAVIQPNLTAADLALDQGLPRSLELLARLTRQTTPFQPDLVVWPETALSDIGRNPRLQSRLSALTIEMRAALLTGSAEHFKFQSPKPKSEPGVLFVRKEYNSAFFVGADGRLEQPYRKIRPVPFGEYMPLAGVLCWASRRPIAGDVLAGDQPRVYRLHSAAITPIICWENLFSDQVRATTRGADLLVQLTNDRWLGASAGPLQHNRASVLRAVEDRVPVVVASNTGPSELVAASGRIVARHAQLFSAGVLTAVVPLAHFSSVPFLQNGMVALCGLVVLVQLALRLAPGRTMVARRRSTIRTGGTNRV